MTSSQTILADKTLFQSFFMGGFECSCQRLRSGKRLDVMAATQHDHYAEADYKRLKEQGLYTARDGLRWHLIERTPGYYDFSSAIPLLHAARKTGIQIIWDLCHYGWPDNLDIFRPDFVRRFACFARACTQVLVDESDILPVIVPINEISFWAWAGGDVAYLNPFAQGRGNELKEQLVRATIEAIEAIWSVNAHIRIAQVEPAINVIAAPDRPQDHPAAEAYRLAQYETWDMLSGRQSSHLGGREKYLDIIGVNYYPTNQWFSHNGYKIPPEHWLYRPFRHILGEIYQRYSRPVFIAETGIEDEARPAWLRYVSDEVQASLRAGVPVEGICLYPILNHPGWEDERHCCNGLWDYPDEMGEREIYQPLAQELRRQRALVDALVTSQAIKI
jgi:beta-glucosidase/6-phospho-beta-glucosidase/beta-galactosidase